MSNTITTFDSTKEAFQFFIDEIYPTLSSEEIQKIKKYVYYFRNGYSISEKKMDNILTNFGKASVKKIIEISF